MAKKSSRKLLLYVLLTLALAAAWGAGYLQATSVAYHKVNTVRVEKLYSALKSRKLDVVAALCTSETTKALKARDAQKGPVVSFIVMRAYSLPVGEPTRVEVSVLRGATTYHEVLSDYGNGELAWSGTEFLEDRADKNPAAGFLPQK
jgi:hypothetical protein